MGHIRSVAAIAAALTLAPFAARADYETHPDLRPEVRCAAIPPGVGDPKDPGGVKSLHCQRLFWDLPATTKVGTVRVAAPFAEDPIPRFPNGLTDRIPPMYVANGQGYEKPGTGRVRLCSDVDHVPYWKEILNADGSPKIGTDDRGYHSVDDPSKPQTGPLFQLACHRGSRTYYGPWQTGPQANKFDEIQNNQKTRFENTARLDRDVAAGRTTANKRVEWNTGSEFYNHFASHHGTCYTNPDDACSNPSAPKSREAFQPGGECWAYQKSANGPDDPEGRGTCYAGDEDRCTGGAPSQAFRNATQLPGRLTIAFPGGRGMLGVEDQLWGCNHHVVTQLPPGSYGMTRLANYRLQKSGVRNTTSQVLYGANPGDYIGGSVGEMIIQYFTEPANAGVKPINFMFNAVGDLATTAYAPFTWNYHESEWFPPYDAAITHMAIHSHHRMVKGTMNLAPPHEPRSESSNPLCGGIKGGVTSDSVNLYSDWYWEDAPVCNYWKDPDGPVIIRKGQSVRTTCFVNNGVTPEAIKHGLVAGSTVESLRSLGAPIPQQPAGMPASSWGGILADSPVGQEFLYGTHPTNNYRVKYTCGAAGAPTQISPIGTNCAPNPAVDGDGDYVDGP
ncbi:MAG: hypothetical protein QOD06_2422, partial [Candidatus Binatota bacterium]|nr:hypothetical protein [Candidatus Binatota bacterium]